MNVESMATNNPKEYKGKFTVDVLSNSYLCSSTLSIGERQFRIRHRTTEQGILEFYILFMDNNKWITRCNNYRDININLTINTDMHTRVVKISHLYENRNDPWYSMSEFVVSKIYSNIGITPQRSPWLFNNPITRVRLTNLSAMLSMVLDENYIKISPFAPLHGETSLTDFELRCESGSIPVHRVVLAVSSPVFKTFLESKNNWLENRWYKFSKTDVSTLQHLKDYIYLGVLPEEGVENLLLLASCYMIEDLKHDCISKIIAKVTPENALEISEFAVTNKMTELYLKFLKKVQDGKVNVAQIPFV